MNARAPKPKPLRVRPMYRCLPVNLKDCKNPLKKQMGVTTMAKIPTRKARKMSGSAWPTGS